MRKKVLYALCALILCSNPMQADSIEDQAKDFIQKLGDDAIKILKRGGSDASKRKQFESLFKTRFALSTIAKQVMGKYWRQASSNQKKEFLELFKKTTLETYTSRISEYGNEKFEVTKSQKRTGTAIFVESNVIQANGKPLKIKWLVLRGRNGDYRVGDVYIGDLSQLATQRSEYAAIIRRKGIDGLLHSLRAKLK